MLTEKIIFIPPMDFGYGEVVAAVFRSAGFSAEALPTSDGETRTAYEGVTSGDECFPFQVLTGDLIKRIEQGDISPVDSVFFLPVLEGACRYSRFTANLAEILDQAGYGDVDLLSPTPSNGHAGLAEIGPDVVRNAWHALVSADVLQRLLLKTRPFETTPGDADTAFEEALGDLCAAIETHPGKAQTEALKDALTRARDRFRIVPIDRSQKKFLIGIVGEFFGRFNPLLNNDLIRIVESCGAEVRLAGVAQEARLYFHTLPPAETQDEDFKAFVESLCADFGLPNESDHEGTIAHAGAYIPFETGGTALRLGQIVRMAKEGVDGVIDINFFPCMNAPSCTAFYPKLTEDLGGLPLDTYFFKGGIKDPTRRVDNFLKQVREYRNPGMGGKGERGGKGGHRAG